MKFLKDKVLIKELFKLEKEMSEEAAIIDKLKDELSKYEKYEKAYPVVYQFNFNDIRLALSEHYSKYYEAKKRFKYIKSIITGKKEESIYENGSEYKKVKKQIDNKYSEFLTFMGAKEVVITVDEDFNIRYSE